MTGHEWGETVAEQVVMLPFRLFQMLWILGSNKEARAEFMKEAKK